MADQKSGRLILEAIDQLRKRKARPDLDRICHMLERRHGLKGPDVNEELTRLVQEGAVIKVDYKGNTSYRNAAKWPKTKSHFYGNFYNSSDISSILLEAVKSITKPGKDQPMRSASLQEIELYLLNKDSQSNLNLATLRTVLQNEVDRQNLHQLPNGEFILLNSSYSESGSLVKHSSPEPKSEGTPIKRLKSDSDSMCQENSSNSSSESQPSQCGYCLFYSTSNRKGEPEELLTCRDCGAKAHPSCMEYTKLLSENYPHPRNWQCPDCKTCCICEDSRETTDVITCYMCFKGYHMSCHDPIITSKPRGTWFCCTCDTNNDRDKFTKGIAKSNEPAPEPSILHATKDVFHRSLEHYPNSIPVAKKWSIENVESFFKFIGFEDEAPAFREQEIDGLSLLLMKRSDVLTGLGIKLGPALKIYKHIVNLQSHITEN